MCIKLIYRFYSNAKLESRMRAWHVYNYGGPLSQTNGFISPSISYPFQVLVKVKAASINPMDTMLIKGYGSSLFTTLRKLNGNSEFPLRPGRDFSGEVVKIGRNVKQWSVGSEVMGALWPFEEGSLADYVVVCSNQLASKPTNISYNEAASVPYAGLTAYSALVEFGGLTAGNAPGKHILIIGSGGGVGIVGVQLAKFWGSSVSVICKENGVELMKDLGADTIYGNEGSSIANDKFDIVLDCIGDKSELYHGLLKSGFNSRYVTLKQSLLRLTDQYSPFVGLPMAGLDFAKNALSNAWKTNGSMYQWAFFRASGHNLGILSRMIEKNQLRPVIDEVFPFDNTPNAFSKMESSGNKGKIVVDFDKTASAK